MVSVSGVPAYLQVAAAVRRRIGSGEWDPGSKLPTKVSFARRYRVSETVVHTAMDILVQEGQLRRDPHSAALYVSEEGQGSTQVHIAQILGRLDAVEAQLRHTLHGAPGTAGASGRPGCEGAGRGGEARPRDSRLHGAWLTLLREVNCLRARMGLQSRVAGGRLARPGGGNGG
ncbi:winged helix-turn-helix domain-containing protein [Streptomyces lydicus]|uniref:winged helix-turn-helix domain-containing protein n=1 Tax=Streptomyces lydicus TaxID=47763 RepID=UPI00101276AD|nr:GntR family transcriptional regulator [Streptomyces lydicus]MCZ1011942.1 GntR family transcriptional regulator [Streptomyces lydicus]